MKRVIAIAAAASLLMTAAAYPAFAGATGIPDGKRTKAELYLSAVEASALLDDPSVILLDVRTRPEIAFLGMPARADANIPLMILPEHPKYDAEKQSYALERNPSFESDFESFAFDRDLTPETKIVIICRSGSRSAKAANTLYDLGFHNVYSVIDGYEGDKAKDGPDKGHRVVNGWKNAGLEWTYAIAPRQVYPGDRD